MSGSYKDCFFEADPVTRSVQTFHALDDGDRFVIQDAVDVEPIIDRNKALYTMEVPRNEWRRVASIPNHIWVELREQGITRDQKAFARWLNNPDNRYFRTAPGKV